MKIIIYILIFILFGIFLKDKINTSMMCEMKDFVKENNDYYRSLVPYNLRFAKVL